MRNTINIIHKAVLAVLAIVLAAGCVSEKDDISVDTNDVMVLLNVSAGEMQTKAIDESAIKTVRVFAFDNSGSLVGHLFSQTPGSDMHLILSVPEGQTTMDVDFYAVANEGAMYYDDAAVTLSDNMTIDELNAIIYSSLMTTENALPLYGKADKNLTLNSGSQHTVGGHTGFKLNESVNIKLERSLAKIGVYAAAKGTAVSPSPVIHSVTFKSAGRRNLSYLFEASDDVALKARDADISSLSSDRVFDPVADNVDMLANGGVVDKSLEDHDTNPENTGLYTEIVSPFYIAEVPYGSHDWSVAADAAGRPVVLVIEYSFGEGTIKKYAEVNMPPIVRNTFYQVRCLIKSDGQILVNVSVAPWEAGEDNVFTFDFPTHNDPLYKTGSQDTEGKYVHTYGTEATAYYSADGTGAFSVDFNMSYPVGGIWKPLLSRASNDDFSLKLYKRGTNEEVVFTDGVQVTDENADQWYTIKVIPSNSANVGKKVLLGISYITSYMGEQYSYLLQINGGEENNLAWIEATPQTGDEYEASTVAIVITQTDTQSGN